MNKEIEIIEGNKLIAQFMGIETKVYSDTPTVTLWNFDGFMRQENDMKYDTSWDWLMPVVEKIGNNYHVNILIMGEAGCVIAKPHTGEVLFDESATNGEEFVMTVFRTVVSFIKFYNQQPETTPQEKQS